MTTTGWEWALLHEGAGIVSTTPVPTLICSTDMDWNACVAGEVNYFTASQIGRSIRLDKVDE